MTSQTFRPGGLFATKTEDMVEHANAWLDAQRGVRRVIMEMSYAYGAAKFLTLSCRVADEESKHDHHLAFFRLIPRFGLGRRVKPETVIDRWADEHPKAEIVHQELVASADGLAPTQLFILWKEYVPAHVRAERAAAAALEADEVDDEADELDEADAFELVAVAADVSERRFGRRRAERVGAPSPA
jgi:hypothetical protein